MTAIYALLIRSFFFRALGLSTAALALLTIASLAESRTPDLTGMLGQALPFAACIAATWSVGVWRSDGAHIVLGNRGHSPALAVFLLTVCACPALLTPPRAVENSETWGMAISPESIEVRSPGNNTTIRWEKARAIKKTPRKNYETSALRPPIGSSSQSTDAHAFAPFVSMVLLFMVLWMLAFRRKEPAFFPTLFWGAAVYAVGPLISVIFP